MALSPKRSCLSSLGSPFQNSSATPARFLRAEFTKISQTLGRGFFDGFGDVEDLSPKRHENIPEACLSGRSFSRIGLHLQEAISQAR